MNKAVRQIEVEIPQTVAFQLLKLVR